MVISLQIKLVLQVTLLLLALYLGLTVHTVLTAPPSVAALLYSETSAYEVFSYWLWGLLALLSLTSNMPVRTRIAISAAALIMAARELDMHKSLFSMSFIKTKFYTSPDIIISDKLIGAAIIALILTLAIYLIRKFIANIKKRHLDISSLFVIIGLGLGALSKILDRFSSQMRELFDIIVTSETRLMVMALEESLEMIVPALLIIALLTAASKTKCNS